MGGRRAVAVSASLQGKRGRSRPTGHRQAAAPAGAQHVLRPLARIVSRDGGGIARACRPPYGHTKRVGTSSVSAAGCMARPRAPWASARFATRPSQTAPPQRHCREGARAPRQAPRERERGARACCRCVRARALSCVSRRRRCRRRARAGPAPGTRVWGPPELRMGKSSRAFRNREVPSRALSSPSAPARSRRRRRHSATARSARADDSGARVAAETTSAHVPAPRRSRGNAARS